MTNLTVTAITAAAIMTTTNATHNDTNALMNPGTTNGLSMLHVDTHQVLTFCIDGKELVISTETGKVTIPDGMEMDEAARLFWSAVERAFPDMFTAKRAVGRAIEATVSNGDWLNGVTK